MEGVLLLNKPKGCTSFDVVRKVRSLLRMKAVGHTGTLDPMASGLLVLLLGRYTRASQWLTAAQKTYIAEITFGYSTTTDDAEGGVLRHLDHFELSQEQVESVLQSFVGEQWQVPPAFSAISINGERAYHKARRGEEVQLAPRLVQISKMELLDFSYPKICIRLQCSKGTYVRSLARDIGLALHLPAHLSGLCRQSCGSYFLEEALSEEQWSAESFKQNVLCGQQAFRDMPSIEVDDRTASRMRQGQNVLQEGAGMDGHRLAHTKNGEPVAFVHQMGCTLKVLRCF